MSKASTAGIVFKTILAYPVFFPLADHMPELRFTVQWLGLRWLNRLVFTCCPLTHELVAGQ